MDVALNNSAGFLSATLSGEFSLTEAQRTFMEIVQAVKQHDAGNVLVDGSAVTGKPTVIERFAYGEFVANAVAGLRVGKVPRTPRFAYVLIEPVLDRQRLGENVAVNRGMNVKTFDNFEDALAWLDAADT